MNHAKATLVICILLQILTDTIAQNNSLSGRITCQVTSSESKRPLINSQSLLISKTDTIKVSCDQKAKCFFSNIAPGVYSVFAYAPEHDTSRILLIEITNNTDTLLFLELKPQMPELPRLTITPDRSIHDAFVTSASEFKSRELLNTAGTGNDLNRTLALHPSANSMNSIDNNSLYIRGGEVQENGYCIDGIEVTSINHYTSENSAGAMGFISADLVNRIRINTVMQPYLPPRNSSVIEIELKDHPEKKTTGQLDLNISGIGLQLQGTTNNQHSSYLANVRWMDMKPLEMFTQGVWSQFGDIVLKGTVALNDYHTIGSTSIISYDKTRSKTTWNEYHPNAQYQKELLQINTGMYSILYKENISNKCIISLGYISDEYSEKDTFSNYFGTLFPYTYIESKDRRNHILCTDLLTYHISDNFNIGTGVRLKATNYSIYKKIVSTWDDPIPNSYETGGHLQGQLTLNNVTIISGVRCDYFSSIKDIGIAPYLGIALDTKNIGILTFQSSYSYQNPPDFERNLGWRYFKNYDISSFVLQKCLQSSFLYQNTIRNIVTFSAEPYLKYYNNKYPYTSPYFKYLIKRQPSSTKTYNYQTVDANGKKYSTGLELSIHNVKETTIHYRFALAFSKTKNRYTNGEWYNDENDIRVSTKLVLGAHLRKYHDISFTSLAAEGRPYSSTDSQEPSSLWFVRRFDPTFFLSARYGFTYPGKHLKFGVYIDVQNILNQTHTVAILEVATDNFIERKMNGILPTAGVTIAF